MAGSLACLLSYGLTCAPATVEVKDVPPPSPLEPATPGAPPVAAPPKGEASRLLAKVQAFYNGTKDFQADFKQTYVHSVYKTKKVSKGKLRVKKPGRMVWDYGAADNADFWVDGKNVWVVERATKQVIKRSVEGSDIAGAEKFLFGGRELTRDFKVKLAGETLEKRYGIAGHTAVRLKPKKKNAHYKEIMLVVDEGSGRVDAFIVLNQDASTNHFVLTGINRNGGLKDSDFKFKKPSGYVQIDG